MREAIQYKLDILAEQCTITADQLADNLFHDKAKNKHNPPILSYSPSEAAMKYGNPNISYISDVNI